MAAGLKSVEGEGDLFHPTSLRDLLVHWAGRTPDAPAFHFTRPTGEAETVTFAGMAARARAIADGPLAGTAPGDRVILPFRPGLEFILAFFGCQYAGAVPVPLPPLRPREFAELPGLAADCGANLVLSHEPFVPALAGCPVPLRLIEEAGSDVSILAPDRPAADLAFIQYTSGSTGDPKGVAIGQDNVLSNIRTIIKAFGVRHGDTGVTWLPPHHDMGLVGGLLTPVFAGNTVWIMAPGDFVRAPLSWIDRLARTGATVAGGPNFAFDLCAQRLLEKPDALPADTDLSAWRVAFCGAEPVRAETLRRFAAAFAPLGFDPKSFLPCYGMAEATLFVSGTADPPPRLIARFDAEALRQRGRAEPAADGRELVSCGRLDDPDFPRVTIIGEDGRPRPEGEAGEILVAGSGIARGYWGRDALTAETFPGGALRTGDRGFIHGGRLFVIGRIKDIIIHNGQNHAAEDIEGTALAAVEGRTTWLAAAFAIEDGQAERLIVLLEGPRGTRLGLDVAAVTGQVRAAIAAAHGFVPHEIVLLAPGALPRTTSGKVRRGQARDLFRDDALRRIAAPQPAKAVARAGAGSLDDRLAGLAAAFARILNIDAGSIDPDAPLGALGIDSVNAVALRRVAEDALDDHIPVELVQGELSLRDLATMGAVESGRYWADASLAADLVPAPGEPDGSGPWLVTGGTGLVGARVIATLLARGDERVIGLGRVGAGDRLRATLAGIGVGVGALDRLDLVEGDFSAPRLGLAEETWRDLADRVGIIIHCAAELSFIKPYAALRPVNVDVGRALLALMACGRPKRMVHLSSVSVLETPSRAGRRLAEDTILDFPETLPVGYAQSKWVADRMMGHARDRGFAVAVARPPWIIGATASEMRVGGDFLARFLRACARAGGVPAAPFLWNVVSASFVADSVVAIAADAGFAPVHHLGLAESLPMAAMADALARAGAPVGTRPVDDWVAGMLAGTRDDESHPLLPLLPLFAAHGGRAPKMAPYAAGLMPAMDSRRTLERLAEAGVSCPAPDLTLLARHALGQLL
jgi:thioester reductase-like protein